MNEMPVKPNDPNQDNTPPEQPQNTSVDTNLSIPVVTPAQASDKTVPGGRYVVDNQVVNANGEPIKE